MRTPAFMDQPGRIAIATGALFLATLLGPCESASAGQPAEARLGLLFGVAIGLAMTRALRRIRLEQERGDENPDAT